MQAGFNGISFPFRINSRGGVAMSTTDISDVPHIVEAVQQILLTRPGERCMEYHFKSDLDLDIFEPNDVSAHKLIEHQIMDALTSLEDRIEIKRLEVKSQGSNIYVSLTFKVLKYNTQYTENVKVGEISETSN